jgi:hypothetical protein
MLDKGSVFQDSRRSQIEVERAQVYSKLNTKMLWRKSRVLPGLYGTARSWDMQVKVLDVIKSTMVSRPFNAGTRQAGGLVNLGQIHAIHGSIKDTGHERNRKSGRCAVAQKAVAYGEQAIVAGCLGALWIVAGLLQT